MHKCNRSLQQYEFVKDDECIMLLHMDAFLGHVSCQGVYVSCPSIQNCVVGVDGIGWVSKSVLLPAIQNMAITWPGRNDAPDWPIYLFPDNTLSTVLLRDDVVSCSKLWRYGGSNPRPFTCKANALPLSYIPSSRIGKWRKLFRKLHIQRRVKGVERYKRMLNVPWQRP